MAKILLVEDDEDLQSVMIFNLTAAGHEVRACGLGFEALKELDSWHPEIVLLDVMLPDISGTEVCRRLRANPALQELAIIMASAKGEDIDKIVGLEIGADDYLVKPFHIRELLLRIRNIEGRPR